MTQVKVGLLQLYAGGLVALVALLALVLLRLDVGLGAPLWLVCALVVLAIAAERQSIYISANTQMSVSVLPILFAAVVGGPLAAMVVGGCALLADFRAPYTRWVIWTSSRSLAAGVAGMAGIALLGDARSFGTILAAVAAAAAAEALADVGLTSLTAVFRRNAPVRTAHDMARLLFVTMPLYVPVLAVLAFAYEALSPWTVLLFFVPALAAQRLFVLYREQRRLTNDLESANDRLERASLSFASALVSALDARDAYTAGHSAAVAVYSRDIAARLGLGPREQELAHLCGLLHDIGKVGLPAGLLEKSGPLSLHERRQMEGHAAIGDRILANVEGYAEVARIVRHHHERVDGRGYPDGLESGAIPLLSRIIGVADAYNAMTSGRPYRDAMPSQVARLRLAQAVESQFDTSVVAAFEAILAGSTDTYRSGLRADFAVEAQRHSGFGRPAVSAVS